MPNDLRCKVAPPILAKLNAIQAHLGYRLRAEAVEHLIVEAHGRMLGRTHWEQQQAHAWRVLKRLKPGWLVCLDEITGVSFLDGGDRVCIYTTLNSAPYQVSRREWEK